MSFAVTVGDVNRTSVQVVKHSKDPNGRELFTALLSYPNIIHAQVMTHRKAARNGLSLRAVPTEKIIKRVEDYPYIPKKFPKNGKGMQPKGFLEGEAHDKARNLWVTQINSATSTAEKLHAAGVHKEVTNRVLFPYMYTRMVFTFDLEGLKHFLYLREHGDAQGEIQELARCLREAYEQSMPDPILPYDPLSSVSGTETLKYWHLPFVEESDITLLSDTIYDPTPLTLCRISAARCARGSYENYFGRRDVLDDIPLASYLVDSKPEHASPTEHQARVLDRAYDHYRMHQGLFEGFLTYRRLLGI